MAAKKRKRVKRKGKAALFGLAGATKTCAVYECVRGAGGAKAGCKPGYVLRCAEYFPEPGIAPDAGQRKGYRQYIYGKSPPGRAPIARSRYTPGDKRGFLSPVDSRARSHGPVIKPGPGRSPVRRPR